MQVLDFTKRHKFINWFKSIDIIGFRYISHFLPQLLLPKPSGKSTIKTIHGFNININPTEDAGLEKAIYYNGTYELGTLNLLKALLANKDTFIDVGANIGLMSIFASQVVGNEGKVFAFEANPKTVTLLQNNLALNNIKNVTVYDKALGEESGKAKIFTNLNQNRGSASLVIDTGNSDFFEIDVIKFDDIVELKSINPALIKMDIEGFELYALRGMQNLLSALNAPNLIIECSEPLTNSESSKFTVFRYVKNCNNYKIFKLNKGKGKSSSLIEIKQESDLPSHDNMICIHHSKLAAFSSLLS